jgi:hypothetical protein
MILPFVLQQLDYIQYIDFIMSIKAFHVKDAEFNPTGKGTLVDTKVG